MAQGQTPQGESARAQVAESLMVRDNAITTYFFPFVLRELNSGKLTSRIEGYLASDIQTFTQFTKSYDALDELRVVKHLVWDGTEATTMIHRSGKRSLKVINSSLSGSLYVCSPLTMFLQLGLTKWAEGLKSDKKDFESLGEREISGRKCIGIRMALKLGNGAGVGSPIDLWIDDKETLIIWELSNYATLGEAKGPVDLDCSTPMTWRGREYVTIGKLTTKVAKQYSGIWIPTKIEQIVKHSKYVEQQNVELEEDGVEINQPLSAALEIPESPAGTWVKDSIRDREYKVKKGGVTDGDAQFLELLSVLEGVAGRRNDLPLLRHFGFEEHSARVGAIFTCCQVLEVPIDMDAIQNKIFNTEDLGEICELLKSNTLYVEEFSAPTDKPVNLPLTPMVAILEKRDATITHPIFAYPMTGNRVLIAFPNERWTVVRGELFRAAWTGRALLFARSKEELARSQTLAIKGRSKNSKPQETRISTRTFIAIAVLIPAVFFLSWRRRKSLAISSGQ